MGAEDGKVYELFQCSFCEHYRRKEAEGIAEEEAEEGNIIDMAEADKLSFCERWQSVVQNLG